MEPRKRIELYTTYITDENIRKTEQVLIDNGIEPDEAQIVLEAIGFTLLGENLYE